MKMAPGGSRSDLAVQAADGFLRDEPVVAELAAKAFHQEFWRESFKNTDQIDDKENTKRLQRLKYCFIVPQLCQEPKNRETTV